jgi:heme A synthase
LDSRTVDRQPPLEVVAASALLAISFVLGAIAAIVRSPPEGLRGQVIGGLMICAVAAWIVWKLYTRRNWMRWWQVGLIVGAIGLMAFHIAKSGSAIYTSTFYLQAVMQAGAAVLLVLPKSNGWFAKPAPKQAESVSLT